MVFFTLAFLLGNITLQAFATLPSFYIVLILLLATHTVWWFFRKKFSYIYIICGLSWGFAWTWWIASSYLAFTLPKNLEEQSVIIRGHIASIPKNGQRQLQTKFCLEEISTSSSLMRVNTHILLSLPMTVKFHVGEVWQFKARLKRMHANLNPGTFDYEAWAFSQNIRAQGRVVNDQENKVLHSYWYLHPINQLRQIIIIKIKKFLPPTKTSAWLLALIVGERSNISADQWLILRKTGTNHLMAIAGLHIGLITGLIYSALICLWKRSKWLNLRWPMQHVCTIGALVCATFYSALSGFSIPTQRAGLMFLCAGLVLVNKRKVNHWSVWAFALLFVLILNPFNVLAESFWLSFATLVLIIYGMQGRLQVQGWWWKYFRIQWLIGLGLLPLTLIFFHEFSLISFIANSIAIPWLCFFILPFCLFATLSIFLLPGLGHMLLVLADKSLSCLWQILSFLAQLPLATWQQYLSQPAIIILCFFGVLYAFIPKGMPGRHFAWFFLLPLLSYQSSNLLVKEFRLTLLDVGQGLAIIVQTQHHTLVYDTGPKIGNYDASEKFIIPYLQSIGVKKIDVLVISHNDNDHVGGIKSLLATFHIEKIYTSSSKGLTNIARMPCLSGQAFMWEGVQFRFLYPFTDVDVKSNNRSCVLRISNEKYAALLPGDIEKTAEDHLLNSRQPLRANILLAPHHGSKTSINPRFLSAVSPQYVLYATGYLNRYGFPHTKVMQAYSRMQTKQLNTVTSGAIIFRVTNENLSYFEYRKGEKRYWFD